MSTLFGVGRIPVGRGFDTMQALSISSLQWVVGMFIATLGALMLVSPHQFSAATYSHLSPHLAWFGPGFLLAGAGLLAVATPGPRFQYVVLAHLWAGGMLLFMAAGYAFNGSWSGTSNYGVLGLGTAVAPLLTRYFPQRAQMDHPLGSAHRRGDAFAAIMGLATALTGLFLVAMPSQFTASVYDPIRLYLPLFGLVFVTAGSFLCASQFGYLLLRRVDRWSPIPVAGALLLFGASVALPIRAWTGIAYYGGFGSALVILAWMGPQLRQLDPGSLRTRLALVLAAAAAVPVLVLTPLYSHEEENQAVTAQLARQQSLASALAQDVADYVTLHQAVVKLLATQPGLLALSPGEVRLLLQNSKAAYPDVNGFGLVSADGDPIARSDDRQGTSWIGDRVFEEMRRTNQPVLDVRISPVVHRPVFTFGVPILDVQGKFSGMVSASVASTRMADVLSRNDLGGDVQTYLVDATGRIIAHPDLNLVASLADLSGTPSVVALLSDPAASGSLRAAGPNGEVLASFAHVPDLGWGVVVERSSATALAPTRAKLDVLFAGLMVLIGAAAGFGVLAAGWLSRPLVTLSAAVDGLAAGDDSAPLPAGGLTEVAGLANTFGAMRARVISHTAELLAANTELETLYHVGQAITAPLQLDVALNTIARCTAEVLGTESAAILLVDQATQTLAVQGAYGLSELAIRGTRVRIGESIAGRVVLTGQPTIANDLPNNPLFFNPSAEQEKFLACASVPLIVGDKIIGTLDGHSKTNRFAFGNHDIEVLQMLASQAAIVIEKARLYQELRMARDDLEVRVHARTAELIAANKQLQQEITERQEAESARRRTEAQARRLIESNVIGTIVADLGGEILEANDAFLTMVGYTRAELQSGQLRWDTLTPPEYVQLDERALEELRATGSCSPWEKEYLSKDGGRIPVLVGVAMLEQDPNTCVAFILDLTEQKQAEMQIRGLNGDLERRVGERTAELEAVNRELEAFSYSVSHDLRAPLRAINGFSRILLEEYGDRLEPEAQKYLGLVRDNARQMGTLIDDLLNFSRLSRQGLRKDRVLPADIARQVLGDQALELEGRSVEVVVGEMLPCLADAALFKQIFVNLLSNAFKFTRHRAVSHVEIGCSRVDGDVVYFVKDNGAGFDMQYANKLFGVFQRLHRAEDYEGTGVGLAIVKRIVQRHGGRVWAEGALDHGATFSFTLTGAHQNSLDWSVPTQLNSPYPPQEDRSAA
jgi:PAS domain S-box-containing protein